MERRENGKKIKRTRGEANKGGRKERKWLQTEGRCLLPCLVIPSLGKIRKVEKDLEKLRKGREREWVKSSSGKGGVFARQGTAPV